VTAAPLPIVLVHGGAHGAWCWEPLRSRLADPVLAVDLPPRSIRGAPRAEAPPETATIGLDDFAASVLADVDAAGHSRFVLVGHSMGGLTVCEVARRAPQRVAHLMLVSCIVPPEGGSVIDTLPAEVQAMTRDAVAAARAGGPPMAGLDEPTIRRMFCNDMDQSQTAFVLDHCGAEAASVFGERVTRRGTPATLPSTYVRLRRDQALSPADQDAQIAAWRQSPGGPIEVLELDTGHDVMISAPDLLGPLLEDVRRAAR
jgi:pimeloyl-ACP methyl ester carboxylesterase